MGIIIAQWKPCYETGNNLIDEQHKSLFSTINSLNNAMLEGQGQTIVRQTLESLQDYTTIHFDTEEQFMRDHQYPRYLKHKMEHEALKAKVAEFERENDDLSSLTIAVSEFLTNWLIHHIKDEDQQMIKFCCHGHLVKSNSHENHGTIVNNSEFAIARWRSEYETGYTLIDDQHKSLFHAINALHSAMLAGRAEELLQRTLKSLRNYTTIHFETEEQFMLKYGYPDYLDHKAKHEVLRQKVEVFNQEEKTQDKAQLTMTVSSFLTGWLIHHIRDDDQKMIRFLHQQREKNRR